MYFFKTTNGKIDGDLVAILTDEAGSADRETVSRWNFKTLADAEAMAVKANALNDGTTYIATDAGSCTSPRYDVQAVPKVGQDVSYGFNGDYYPCGKIVSVGKGAKMIVKTDTGKTFYRRKLTGSWLMEGGTWWLVQGTHNEKNPHF